MPCPCCGGACCLPDGTCMSGLTQAECEDCPEIQFWCVDVIGRNEDGSCPAGYTPKSETLCESRVEAAGCEECLADCDVTDAGLCGTYYPGQTCEQICCGSCDEENPCAEGCVCVDGECVTGGACCLPELEPCVYVTGPCPEEGDCGDGLICNDDGNCQGFGDFPIGECPGTVTGPPVPGECQDGLTQSACETGGGTYYPGQTCASNPCSGACCSPDGTCVDGVSECPPKCVCEYRVGEATYDEATDSYVCPEGQREEGTYCFEATIVPACPDGSCDTCEACPPEGLTASGPAPSGTYHPGETCAGEPCEGEAP